MKKIGLALSSGGARGFAQIGVLKVLEKESIPISYIAGTSMGALIAAHYALYKNISELEDFALSFTRKDVLKSFDLNDPRKSLIKGKKAKKILKDLFGEKRFKHTKIPLNINATALEDGSEIIFRSGKIRRAVLASGTIPGLLPPVKYKGKHLVDGGLVDAIPVNIVKKMGAEAILAVDLYTLEKTALKSTNLKPIIKRTREILMSKLAEYGEKQYGKDIIVIKPDLGRKPDTFAFHKAKQKIRAGEEATKNALDKIKNLTDEWEQA